MDEKYCNFHCYWLKRKRCHITILSSTETHKFFNIQLRTAHRTLTMMAKIGFKEKILRYNGLSQRYCIVWNNSDYNASTCVNWCITGWLNKVGLYYFKVCRRSTKNYSYVMDQQRSNVKLVDNIYNLGLQKIIYAFMMHD